LYERANAREKERKKRIAEEDGARPKLE